MKISSGDLINIAWQMHSRIVVAVNWTLLACGQEMSRRASQPAVITADCGTAYHCDELKEVQGYFIVNQGQGFGPSCTLGRCTPPRCADRADQTARIYTLSV